MKTESGSWRDQILKEFTPQVARLTLVADPDGLLTEEGVLQGLRERGFELIPFEDPVAFRFAYESKYRSRWDRGELTDLVVVLRAAAPDLRSLPHDLLQAGRKLSFSLGDLFPNLSYPVVAALDRSDLDALYRAQMQHNPGKLGDNATKDFVLRQVFEIAPELIKRPSDLLRVLLRRHYRGQRIPAILDERFVKVLRQSEQFEGWPLERIIPNRHAFFVFLQERWPIFLEHIAADKAQAAYELKQNPAYHLEYSGPPDLPFDHDDVRVYIDDLFLEGLLKPIDLPDLGTATRDPKLLSSWVVVGLRTDPESDYWRRLEKLLKTVETLLPQHDARYQDWLAFAHCWAELNVLWHKPTMSKRLELGQQFRGVQEKVDTTFLTWVQNRYGGLHNQPAVQPAMVHHIPRVLTRHLGQSEKEKVALLLLDGLALDQWVILREVLAQQRPSLRFHEEAVFAWLPTITSVSRQAAFAGKSPVYFPGSIHTTDKEATLWSQFWVNQGLTQVEVAYVKGLGEEVSLFAVEEVLSHPKIRVVGLIIDKIDKIMHGMELGTAGMHNQVRQWAMQGFMVRFLDFLLDRGFSTFLTSDHGNIEAVGIGRPSEGVVADLQGERVRVYPDQILRTRVKERFPRAIEWPPLGLPEGFLPLLAPSRSAFVREGERIVGHGGISVEEVVVPFVYIEQKVS